MVTNASDYKFVYCDSQRISGNIFPLRSGSAKDHLRSEDVLFLHEAMAERYVLKTSRAQQFNCNSYAFHPSDASMAMFCNDLWTVRGNLVSGGYGGLSNVNQAGWFLKPDIDWSQPILVYQNDYQHAIIDRYYELTYTNGRLTDSDFYTNLNMWQQGNKLSRSNLGLLFDDMKKCRRALRYGGNVTYLPSYITSDANHDGWYGQWTDNYDQDSGYYEPNAPVLPYIDPQSVGSTYAYRLHLRGGDYAGEDRMSGWWSEARRKPIYLKKGTLPSLGSDFVCKFLVIYHISAWDLDKRYMVELNPNVDIIDYGMQRIFSEWGFHDKTWQPPDGDSYTVTMFIMVNPIFSVGSHTKWW